MVDAGGGRPATPSDTSEAPAPDHATRPPEFFSGMEFNDIDKKPPAPPAPAPPSR